MSIIWYNYLKPNHRSQSIWDTQFTIVLGCLRREQVVDRSIMLDPRLYLRTSSVSRDCTNWVYSTRLTSYYCFSGAIETKNLHVSHAW